MGHFGQTCCHQTITWKVLDRNLQVQDVCNGRNWAEWPPVIEKQTDKHIYLHTLCVGYSRIQGQVHKYSIQSAFHVLVCMEQDNVCSSRYVTLACT